MFDTLRAGTVWQWPPLLAAIFALVVAPNVAVLTRWTSWLAHRIAERLRVHPKQQRIAHLSYTADCLANPRKGTNKDGVVVTESVVALAVSVTQIW